MVKGRRIVVTSTGEVRYDEFQHKPRSMKDIARDAEECGLCESKKDLVYHIIHPKDYRLQNSSEHQHGIVVCSRCQRRLRSLNHAGEDIVNPQLFDLLQKAALGKVLVTSTLFQRMFRAKAPKNDVL